MQVAPLSEQEARALRAALDQLLDQLVAVSVDWRCEPTEVSATRGVSRALNTILALSFPLVSIIKGLFWAMRHGAQRAA